MEAREGVTMRIRPDLLVLFVLSLLLLPTSLALAAPKIGQPAPDFLFVGASADASAATRFQNADYVGESARKKGVVVAWFPKAFTPG